MVEVLTVRRWRSNLIIIIIAVPGFAWHNIQIRQRIILYGTKGYAGKNNNGNFDHVEF